LNKPVIIAAAGGLLVGAALSWALSSRHAETPAAEGDTSTSHVVRVGGRVLVKLDADTQKRSGITVGALELKPLPPEVAALGHVLDPSPLAILLAERASAQAALSVSSKEFQRLRILHGQEQNVSTRTLEAAQAAANRDQVLLDAVELRLLTAWGKAVVREADTPTFLKALGAQELTLVRVDLPLDVIVSSAAPSARLVTVSLPDRPLEARLLGPVPSVDPQLQGQGFFLLIRGHALPPGTAVTAWLMAVGDARSTAVLPREALLRHEGRVFVYVQSAADLFSRREVALDRPIAAGWAARDGLAPDDKVVVAGAQQLLSEELKGQGEEE
jgi:hypothetical protein